MMHHYKMNYRLRSTSITTNSDRQAGNVRNFMHSLDPSASLSNPNPASTVNTTAASVVTAASSEASSLPFLPDPSEWFDTNNEPFELQSQQAPNHHPLCSPSAFSVVSSATPSSIATEASISSKAAFFPSHQRTIRANTTINGININKNPLIRANLPQFRPRSMATPSSTAAAATTITRGLQMRGSTPRTRTEKYGSARGTNRHTIDIDRHDRYGNKSDHLLMSPGGGLFEADAPEIGGLLPQIPSSWDAAASNSNSNININRCPTPPELLPAPSTPTRTTTTTCTTMHEPHSFETPSPPPKRVSPPTLLSDSDPDDPQRPSAPPPTTILRPQASVATSMAASVLLSLMVTESSGADGGVAAFGGPATKRRCRARPTTPRRVSNFLEEDSRHRSISVSSSAEAATSTAALDPSATVTTTAEPLCELRNYSNTGKRKNRTVSIPTYEELTCSNTTHGSPPDPALCMSPKGGSDSGAATTTDSPTCSNSNSANSISPLSAFKRIPRRFLDDPTLPILKDGMRLAAPNDEEHLNSLHCFVRKELLEVFVLADTTQGNANNDASAADRPKRGIGRPRKKKRIPEEQQQQCQQRPKQIQRVGIRCVHCGRLPKSERDGVTMSTFFPKSLEDVYRGVCTWQRIHFKACKHMPEGFKDRYWNLKDSDRTRGKKAHWIRSARDMGFRNVDGHRSGVVWAGRAAATGPDRSVLDLTKPLQRDGSADSCEEQHGILGYHVSV